MCDFGDVNYLQVKGLMGTIVLGLFSFVGYSWIDNKDSWDSGSVSLKRSLDSSFVWVH